MVVQCNYCSARKTAVLTLFIEISCMHILFSWGKKYCCCGCIYGFFHSPYFSHSLHFTHFRVYHTKHLAFFSFAINGICKKEELNVFVTYKHSIRSVVINSQPNVWCTCILVRNWLLTQSECVYVFHSYFFHNVWRWFSCGWVCHRSLINWFKFKHGVH